MEQPNQTTNNPNNFCCGKQSKGLIVLLSILIAVGVAAIVLLYTNQQKTIGSILKDLQTQITNLQNQIAKKGIPDSDSQNPANGGITVSDVKNAQYSSLDYGNKPIVLSDGVYNYDCGLSSEKCYTKIYDDKFIKFGDLNNDGVEEAVVALTNWGGGTGNFRTLFVLQKKDNITQSIAEISLGDRVVINSLDINQGKIVLGMTVQGLKDGMCCPTQSETRTYILSGNNLVKQ